MNSKHRQVDRYGRRLLMICSAIVVSVSLAAMGSFFYCQKLWGETVASASLGWLPLLSLIVFIIAFSGGFANVPFILMGELFPLRYRSVLGPMSSSFNLLCTFAVVRSFPEMQKTMTKYGAYWFFMCCTLLSIAFVYFFLPETKGKTLEDIEKLFSSSSKKDLPSEIKEDALKVAVIQLQLEEKTKENEEQLAYDHHSHENNRMPIYRSVLPSLNVIESEDEEEPEVVHIPAA